MTYSLISDSYVKRIAKLCFTKYFIAAWCNPFLLYHFSRPGTCAVTLRLHARFPLRRLLLKMKYMKWIKWRIKWSTNDSLKAKKLIHTLIHLKHLPNAANLFPCGCCGMILSSSNDFLASRIRWSNLRSQLAEM